ncbi:MAG: zinc ABC transporter substrate-binding protein [Bermanella sp.]
MQRLKNGVLLLVCLLASNTWAQSSQVLVSIHPVALLIKSAWPQLQVDTLMQANQSPHDFALKPSHRRIIYQAQHVIWLGRDMEPYLSKSLKRHDQVLDLSILFDERVEFAQDEHEDHDGHNHGGQDPHIWLNPNMIKNILALVQTQMGLSEPKAFLANLDTWQQQASKALTGQTKGFISFHDAFHYWVEHFELNQTAVLAVHPEQPIGTRHLLQVRQLLEQGNVACLFVEPQFKASIVDKLQQGTNVPVVLIDPLASSYAVKDGQFLEFYAYLQQKFITCFNSK